MALATDHGRDNSIALLDLPFLDSVGIDFSIADGGHHHVPLLVLA